MRWARRELGVLFEKVRLGDPRTRPVAVELSDEAGLEVLWQRPAPCVNVRGWAIADGGWAWRKPYRADGQLPSGTCPDVGALVTVGWRDGRRLMVDLESFGLTSVSVSEFSRQWAAALAIELANGAVIGSATVTAVGVEAAHFSAVAPDHRLHLRDASRAAFALEAATAQPSCQSEHVSHRSAATRVPLRHSHVLMLFDPDPPVIRPLAASTDLPRGVAVVLVTDRWVDAALHVALDPNGLTARLQPMGIEFCPTVGRFGTSSLATMRSDEPHGGGAGDVVELGPDRSQRANVSCVPDWMVQWLLANRRLAERRRERAGFDPSPVLARPTSVVAREFVPEVSTAAKAPSAPTDGSAPSSRDPSDDAGDRLVVRVLGVPRIGDRPMLRRRELALVVLLACRGTAMSASAVQDALWGGSAVEAKTVWNLVSRVRSMLGVFPDGASVMPSADRVRGQLRLDSRVTTDLALLRRALADAWTESSTVAIRMLQRAIALVEGPPFDAPGYDWAHRDQDVAEAAVTIAQTVERLVDLAVEGGRYGVARDALARGLRSLPGDERLYRLRMRVEAAIGNSAGVASAYDELCVYLADLDTQPSPTTVAEFHELVGRTHAASRA